MAKAAVMTIGVNGVEISLDYNESTLRLTQVTWSIITGYAARIRIWNSGILAIDRTIGGPASGAENIPGNFQMVEQIINGTPVLVLPPEINYILNIESIG